jgi:hypothetical protein
MQTRLAPLYVTCLLAGAAGLRAAEVESGVQLTGITHFGDKTRAHLEIRSPLRGAQIVRPILSEGDRIGAIEVRKIDSQAGLVRIANNGVEITLLLDEAPGAAKRTLHFKETDLVQVLETYQELSGRTVLRSSDLPGVKISLKTASLPSDDALELLADALLDRGVAIELRADKFALAIRTEQVERLSHISTPPAPEVAPIENDAKRTVNWLDVFPAGLIKFGETDPSQVLEIYQELSGRTVVRPSALRGGKVSLRTQTPLTRREAMWVVEAGLALADIAVVPQGEKFVFVLSGIENPQIPVLDPLPEHLPAGEPQMITLREAGLAHVLKLYATLVGREALPVDKTTPAVKLTLRTQTLVTPREAVVVLDALAAVNHLKFVLVGDHQVKIIPAALARIESRPDAP